jgi:hypothetical protein
LILLGIVVLEQAGPSMSTKVIVHTQKKGMASGHSSDSALKRRKVAADVSFALSDASSVASALNATVYSPEDFRYVPHHGPSTNCCTDVDPEMVSSVRVLVLRPQ